MPLKVGDRVYVRKDLRECRKWCSIGITEDMIRLYAGQPVIIYKIQTYPIFNGSLVYRIRLLHGNDDDYDYVWIAQLFDLSTVFHVISVY